MWECRSMSPGQMTPPVSIFAAPANAGGEGADDVCTAAINPSSPIKTQPSSMTRPWSATGSSMVTTVPCKTSTGLLLAEGIDSEVIVASDTYVSFGSADFFKASVHCPNAARGGHAMAVSSEFDPG